MTSIEHRHGTDLYANRTDEGALDTLHGYVVDNWEREDVDKMLDDDKKPYGPVDTYDKSTAIKIYFECIDGEYWSMQEITVRP